MHRGITLTAAILIGIGVILGAFGAHSLKPLLSEEQLLSYETGVRYQLIHGVAMLALGVAQKQIPFRLTWSFRLLFFGTILFSGSIYFLSLQPVLGAKLSFLGPITPIGGTLLIAGWIVFIVNVLKSKGKE